MFQTRFLNANDIQKLKKIKTLIKLFACLENEIERDCFVHWKREDTTFFSTAASREVERMLNNHSIVIVSGHSGSGKSAIIHHIALKYLKNRWLVKPVDSVEEIKEIYKANFIKNKTLFVLNDPVGKESIDEASYSSWRKYEQTLKHFLENVKLIVTCRKSILDETRVQALHLLTGSNVVVIDENQNKLSDLEKRQIFKMHNPKENVSEIKLREILKTDTYFPLLCKLFANKKDPFEDRLNFFREPKEVFQKEINNLKCSNKEKYCGLVCLVFF